MATTEESIQSNIDSTQGKIDANIKKATQLRSTASTWEQTASNQDAWLAGRKCRGTSKSKNECEEKNKQVLADNAKKRRDAKAYRATADNLTKVVIPALEESKKGFEEDLTSFRASANEVSQTLANQGLNSQAIIARETLVGEGQKDALVNTSEAQALSIGEQSNADASNKKKLGLILGAAGLMIVIIVGIVIYKKVKKPKRIKNL